MQLCVSCSPRVAVGLASIKYSEKNVIARPEGNQSHSALPRSVCTLDARTMSRPTGLSMLTTTPRLAPTGHDISSSLFKKMQEKTRRRRIAWNGSRGASGRLHLSKFYPFIYPMATRPYTHTVRVQLATEKCLCRVFACEIQMGSFNGIPFSRRESSQSCAPTR